MTVRELYKTTHNLFSLMPNLDLSASPFQISNVIQTNESRRFISYMGYLTVDEKRFGDELQAACMGSDSMFYTLNQARSGDDPEATTTTQNGGTTVTTQNGYVDTDSVTHAEKTTQHTTNTLFSPSSPTIEPTVITADTNPEYTDTTERNAGDRKTTVTTPTVSTTVNKGGVKWGGYYAESKYRDIIHRTMQEWLKGAVNATLS